MANFQELQAEKKKWSLHQDEKLFEKMKVLEDNVIASTHLVYNSLQEVVKAQVRANTNLNNSINVFNLISFNKFVENLIEESEGMQKANQNLKMMDQTTILGDHRTEDEKLVEALDLAVQEISESKQQQKQEQAQQDEDGMEDA